LIAAALDRAQTRPDVTFETDVEPGEVLFCDSFQIRQALTNVINNSIQALPGPGRVCVEYQREGKHSRIVISDSGPGMSDEVRARAFEPFFTTSPHRVGIGLTAAQRLVESSGGTLVVESAPGAGTTATLSFWCHEGPGTEQARRLDNTAEIAGRGSSTSSQSK
jgi:signal transduction histidine kinase